MRARVRPDAAQLALAVPVEWVMLKYPFSELKCDQTTGTWSLALGSHEAMPVVQLEPADDGPWLMMREEDWPTQTTR